VSTTSRNDGSEAKRNRYYTLPCIHDGCHAWPWHAALRHARTQVGQHARSMHMLRMSCYVRRSAAELASRRDASCRHAHEPPVYINKCCILYSQGWVAARSCMALGSVSPQTIKAARGRRPTPHEEACLVVLASSCALCARALCAQRNHGRASKAACFPCYGLRSGRAHRWSTACSVKAGVAGVARTKAVAQECASRALGPTAISAGAPSTSAVTQ